MSDMNHHDHSPEIEAMKKAMRPQVETDDRYWRSLEQWGKDPEFQKMAEQEFLSSPLREEDREDGWARREFLKLMGASLALGSAGCLRRPVQKIVPYAKQPEEVTLGQALHYSSTWFDGSETFGLLVKTKEGRPIKLEGNPTHPLSAGALSARGQAMLLSCYDPDRLQGPKHNLQRQGDEKTKEGARSNAETISITWSDLDDKVKAAVSIGNTWILTGHVASPTLRQMIKDFQGSTKAQHVAWEPTSPDALAKGQEASYGTGLVPSYRFDRARVIVSVDADFLGTWLTPMAFNKQFADGRRDVVGMSELVSFDTNYSLTGANADKRFKIKPSQQLTVVMGLLHEIVVKGDMSSGLSMNPALKQTLAAYANASELLGLKDPQAISKVAQSLMKAKGESLVVAGGTAAQTEDAVLLQIAVNALNSALGNDGFTVVYGQAQVALNGSTEELMGLMAAMNEGKVNTLIIHGVNPVYFLGDAFKKALEKVETVVYTGSHMDETAIRADFVAVDHHNVEGWGDSEAVAGVYSIQQPTIRPMYDTRSVLLGFAKWSGSSSSLAKVETDFEAVRMVWKEKIINSGEKGFEDLWYDVLQKGTVGALRSQRDAVRTAKVDALVGIKPEAKSGFELVLYPTVQLGQGELANIGWLQELPDVVTKIVWDNYASISLATAEKLKVSEGDKIELDVDGLKVKIPAHIQPGLHDDVVAVSIGYGRTRSGKVGTGIGVDAYPLVLMKNKAAVFSGRSVALKALGEKYQLANVQGHHTMEGRAIVIEATLKEYLENKSAGVHKHHIFTIWPHHRYDGHKWAMSLDLNTCTGCSACVVACQSENNVPIVGKKFVLQGREMHWIRIDRYYTGEPADAEAVFQPVMCQHCDNAPCETVCPVLATVHSDEGLNEMVYNRCVGTRYCVNNCPYKVRRFNWFNYRKEMRNPEHLAFNPEVGVRVRGVMEKCTFCVQRIKSTKDSLKQQGREMKDGDIKVACQQTCPTGAIVFGDVNDPQSQVHKKFKEEPRSYALIEEFNAAPAVRYQTKIRNNNERTINPRHEEAKKGEHA
ncbi:MAG: molybdopterin oxidoreductase, iron-sulfur binding subunit [Pseudomonadota bacterium]